jgi:thiol peroxidase
MERTVTFKGTPLTLTGAALKPGDPAPDATLIRQDLQTVHLKDYLGKVLLISVVPSLDTGVCSAQTRRFNEEASRLPEGVRVLTVSMDLPFAQKRFCGEADIDRIEVLSDYRDAAFGQAYGTLVKELRLNARAVFVIRCSGYHSLCGVCSRDYRTPELRGVAERRSFVALRFPMIRWLPVPHEVTTTGERLPFAGCHSVKYPPGWEASARPLTALGEAYGGWTAFIEHDSQLPFGRLSAASGERPHSHRRRLTRVPPSTRARPCCKHGTANRFPSCRLQTSPIWHGGVSWRVSMACRGSIPHACACWNLWGRSK